jgi:hypothetical protein
MNSEGWDIIKWGTWRYAGEVPCNLRIVKHGWRYGTGDCEDEEDISEDREGEFYYIEFASPDAPTDFKARSPAFSSLGEAIEVAQSQTNGTISWLE